VPRNCSLDPKKKAEGKLLFDKKTPGVFFFVWGGRKGETPPKQSPKNRRQFQHVASPTHSLGSGPLGPPPRHHHWGPLSKRGGEGERKGTGNKI